MALITTWQIEKWKGERGQERSSRGSVNRQLTVIKHMFKMAIEWGMTLTNPASAVKRLPVNDQTNPFQR